MSDTDSSSPASSGNGNGNGNGNGSDPVSPWETVIGLEVHAQLLTRRKIFCGCSTAYGAPANTQTCPLCLGHPGVLPVLNREVVELAMRAASALGCDVQPESRFARKNYFYPDLPKGYQISQLAEPLATGGGVEIGPLAEPKTIRLVRVHLEEDAGKSTHHGDGSWVDFNRSGVPLIEIVGEPDLRSVEDASEYLKELRALLRELDVCDGNMEQGSFRCDANVSVHKRGDEKLGTRTELKNLNSFKFVRDALTSEIERQAQLLEGGGEVVQETRTYDPRTGETRVMRSKEEAEDYRYFPEPDLPPLRINPNWIQAIQDSTPERPRERRTRYAHELGLSEYEANVLGSDPVVATFFEQTNERLDDPKRVAAFLMSELIRELNDVGGDIDACHTGPREVAELLDLEKEGTIARSTAKELFVEMFRNGGRPVDLVEDKGLSQVSDTGEIAAIVASVLEENADKLAEYFGGKDKLFGFFMGQVMKKTEGKANPQVAREALEEGLEENKPEENKPEENKP